MTNFYDFIKGADLHVDIHEREPSPGLAPFYASISGAYIELGNGSLCGTFGDGRSGTEAVAEYCKAIAGQKLVVNPWGMLRRELWIPGDIGIVGFSLEPKKHQALLQMISESASEIANSLGVNGRTTIRYSPKTNKLLIG